jgi:hypothetical protein
LKLIIGTAPVLVEACQRFAADVKESWSWLARFLLSIVFVVADASGLLDWQQPKEGKNGV